MFSKFFTLSLSAFIALVFMGTASICLAQGNTWDTTKTDMPTSRHIHRSCAVNGKIYVIGGVTSIGCANPTSIVEVYDPATDTWSDTLAPMPTARESFGLSAVDGKIYAIGGQTNNCTISLSSVEVYDPVTDTWSDTLDHMTMPRGALSTSVVNGKIYAIGGHNQLTNLDLNIVEEYDPVTDNWETKEPMPHTRAWFSTTVVDGKIYAFPQWWGGPDSIDVYDPDTDTWETKDRPDQLGWDCSASAVNDLIYTFGGIGFMSAVWEYNPVSNTWLSMSPMPTGRADAPATEVNGKIYVIGGSTTSWPSHPASMVEEYTPPQTRLTHDTGPFQFTVIDNGYIGDDGTGTYGGVVFNGNVNAMFTAGFIGGNLGFGGTYGMIGSFTSGGTPVIQDYFNITPFSGFSSDPYFNQISSCETGFTPNPGESAYTENKSKTGQNCFFSRKVFRNNTGNQISNIFFGIFADWDVGGSTGYLLNRGGYDPERNMLYQYENGGAVDPNYYGILPVNVDPNTVKGTVDKDIVFTTLQQLRLDIFYLMTSTDFTPITEDGNYRTYLSTGPYTIYNGDSLTLDYAFVAGTSLADLQTNAEAAIIYWQNSTEVEVEVNAPLTFGLEQNYPNPFNPTTTINYQIPDLPAGRQGLSFVTVKVYDVLGSEIITLVNEEQPAGSYEVEFNATTLPSGIYFYKLQAVPTGRQAGSFVETKKMILIK